jgi:26S proteasome regulatory subunit N2
MSNIRDLNDLFQRTTRDVENLTNQVGGATPFGGRGGRNDGITGSGAAAAAGVLTAVDEDGEGDEEAPVPREFDYYTDVEEDEG